MAALPPVNLPPLDEDAPAPFSQETLSGVKSQAQQIYQSAVAHGRTAGNQSGDFVASAANPPPAFAAAIPAQPPRGSATPGATGGEVPVNVKQPTAEERAKADYEPGIWDFFKDASRGGWREAGAGVAEAGAQAGHVVTMAAGGAAHQVDRAWDLITGKAAGTHTSLEDAVFDFDTNVVKPAIEHWEPNADSGAIAQGIHNFSNMVAYMPLGVAGAGAFLVNSFSHQATKDIDAGMDMKSTLVDSTVTAAANALLLKFLGKDMLGKFGQQIPTEVIRRVATAIPVGDLINMGSDLTKKWLLEAIGNYKAASQIDVTSHLTSLDEAVQNTLFGAAGAIKLGAKKSEAPPPPPEAVKPAKPAEMPPPPADHATVTPQQLAAKNPAQSVPGIVPVNQAGAKAIQRQMSRKMVDNQTRIQVQTTPPEQQRPTTTGGFTTDAIAVQDHPTGEPAAQLRSQLTDMNRGNTPRVAVLITPESAQHLDAMGDSHPVAGPVSRLIENARTQGRVVEFPQGDLVTKTKAVAASAKSRLAAGEDPQSVIGSLTIGAEGPKTPEQSVVVQGREITDGTITHEKAVTPADQKAEMQKVLDSGRLPVVTTPEGALQERVQAIREEQAAAAPKPGEAPTSETPPPEIAAPTPPNEAIKPVRLWQGKAPAGKGVMAFPDAQGSYFTERRDVAEHYAGPEGTVTQHDVTIRNPYRTTENKAYVSPEERAALEAKGYDGIIFEHPSSPGGREYVVFNPEKQTAPTREVAEQLPAEPSKEGSGPATPEAAPPNEAAVKRVIDEMKDHGIEVTPEKAAEIVADRNKTAAEATKHVEIGAPELPGDPRLWTAKDRAIVQMAGRWKNRETGEIQAAPKPEEPIPATAEPAPKGAKPMGTALDQLGAALEAHEKQEAVPEGKAKAAPQMERLQNASAFARVLKQAAGEAAKKGAPEEHVTRATEAANKAINLDQKTPTDIMKSRGTSRVMLNARVREMHAAARQLMGKAKPGDEVTLSPQKKKTKTAEQVWEEAHARGQLNHTGKPKPTEKPVGKPGEPTPEEQRKASRLLSRAIAEEESTAAGTARDALEQHIRDVAARLGTPDNVRDEQIREVMHFLQEQRTAAHKHVTGRMSDTIENEESRMSPEERGELSTVYKPSVGGKASELIWHRTTQAMQKDMEKLGGRLADSGVLHQIKHANDTGKYINLHHLLDTMLQHSEGMGTYMTHLLTSVRGAVPDVPVYPREELVNPHTRLAMGESIKGLFVAGRVGNEPVPFIQIRMKGSVGGIVQSVIHEAMHSASEYELAYNPTGKFAREMGSALEILRNRLRSMHGDLVDQHIKYFEEASRGGSLGVEPEGGVNQHWYGLTNPSEMLAELTNPRFVQEIIDSEAFASPKEDLPQVKGMPSLLMKVMTAISRMLGVENPKLLMHILDLSQGTMAEQRLNPHLAPMYETGFAKGVNLNIKPDLKRALSMPAMRAMAEVKELNQPAPPVKGEPQIRAAVGDEGAKSARDHIHEITSRSVDAARNVVYALKTVGQIFRDGKSAFGHDDATNPLNQLRDVYAEKNKVIQQLRQVTTPVAKAWMRLSSADNLKVGQLMIDTTMYKIDPREDATNQAAVARAAPGFAARHAEYQARYAALSPEARKVYDDATEANRRMRIEERRIAIDTAAEAFDVQLAPDQLAKLRGARDANAYESLIGTGKEIDLGDKNEKFLGAMKDWAGATQMEGPYHHLGRQGEYVLQANPEGTKEFGRSKDKAEAWAETARQMSPDSKATVEERGGQWVVDYKVQHVSMHRTRYEAEKAQKVLEQAGFDPGSYTKKTFTRESAPLSQGMTELMTQARQKLDRSGNSALSESLSSAFLQMQAQRSAYAGSQLMRKNVGGVKASDMRQNFADHSASSIWHAAQVRTIFKQAAAQSRLREMGRDRGAEQGVANKRGEVISALNAHAADEVRNFGVSNPMNRQLARLGFFNYLVSPAHAAIWLTQNMTTGIPWAGARYGYGRSTAAFLRGMSAVTGPALRSTMKAVIGRGGDSEAVHNAIVDAIKKHPTMGKWADAIKQLGDRGVISHGYANELGELAHGGNPAVSRVTDWARLLPHMADAINRVSTALAGLELTGGDLRKTADMIETIHADYSQQNKPLAFKKVNRVWGLNSLTMMKTYAQEMAHLTYSNLAASVRGETKAAKWEAAKTVAGLMVGNALFTGVYGAVGLEPLRFALYAYHKMFDDEGEVWDFKNAIHHFLVDHFGSGAGNALARGPVAAALGVDVSERMGLANLFFHDPPDLFSADKDMWKTFVMDEAGPAVQLIAGSITQASGHIQNGEYAQAVASVIPVKMFQDGVKALELLNTGKRSGLGANITEPSGLDAAKQLFGLKPAAVADAQEKAGVQAEYHRVQGEAKGNLIRQFLKAEQGSPEQDAVQDRIDAFNERNPGAEIRPGEIAKYQRRIEAIEEDFPSRNERAEEAAEF